jgi:hypothetical protein
MAIASLVVASLVAIAVIYREFIHDFVFKPDLDVTFSLQRPTSRETIFESGKKGFWPRLKVVNNGRTAARRCEAVLAEVRMPNGTLDVRYDPLKLRWAIAPIEKGLQPLDIARGRHVDLNIFYTIENANRALFATYADAIGAPIFLEPGDYWFLIVIYGDNIKPVERGLAVHWEGNYYMDVDIREMDRQPTNKDHWPWPIK